jgi:CDP-glucose 4,6-dehydratase
LAAFEQAKPVLIRNPGSVRPWQHVLEPLRGYLMLAERLITDGPPFADGWNFGPSEEDMQSVAWIVEQMKTRWGNGAYWHKDVNEHPHEANFLKLDISKSRNLLGWQPIINLHEAIDLTLDWNKKKKSGANMHDFTLSQIANYQALSDRLLKNDL